MKKKIISMALCLSMLALLIAGGTLAYFTDTDNATNVLTAGNIEILLHESNNTDAPDANYDHDKSGVLVDDDYRKNYLDGNPFLPRAVIEKDVWVENTGTQPAYVRVHIAVPMDAYSHLTDDGNNLIDLGLVTKETGYADSTWTLHNSQGDLNDYTATYGGIEYYVLIATCTEIVQPYNTNTSICLTNVSMLEEVQCSDRYDIVSNAEYMVDYIRGDGRFEAKNGQIPVLVFAEAGQQFSFDNALDALKTQFKEPADAGFVSPLKAMFNADGTLAFYPYN